MYQLLFTKQADRALRKMPRDIARLIREKLNQLAQDPYAQNPNLTKLQGRPGYRLRVGAWRVIYDIEDNRLVIMVLKIALRRELYR
jgi:mRNA interferase RelE/StbE